VANTRSGELSSSDIAVMLDDDDDDDDESEC
jgi:hypothetical protein